MSIVDFSYLPSDIQNIKTRIEAHSERPLRVIYGEMGIGANETLMNNMKNGIPTLIIKKGLLPSNEEILHELFELEIRCLNGNYGFSIESPMLHSIKKTCQRPKVVVSKCHSILYHSFFYDCMIELGYHPTEYIEKQIMQCGDSYPNGSYQNCDIALHVSLDLWHFKLGFGDNTSQSKVIFDRISGEYSKAEEKAKELYKISQGFKEPQDEPTVLSRIFQTLFDYVVPIQHRKEGNTIIYS